MWRAEGGGATEYRAQTAVENAKARRINESSGYHFLSKKRRDTRRRRMKMVAREWGRRRPRRRD